MTMRSELNEEVCKKMLDSFKRSENSVALAARAK